MYLVESNQNALFQQQMHITKLPWKLCNKGGAWTSYEKESYEDLERLKFKFFLFLSHQEMFTVLQASQIPHSSIYCIKQFTW